MPSRWSAVPEEIQDLVAEAGDVLLELLERNRPFDERAAMKTGSD